jgi:hypothetical protein
MSEHCSKFALCLGFRYWRVSYRLRGVVGQGSKTLDGLTGAFPHVKTLTNIRCCHPGDVECQSAQSSVF